MSLPEIFCAARTAFQLGAKNLSPGEGSGPSKLYELDYHSPRAGSLSRSARVISSGFLLNDIRRATHVGTIVLVAVIRRCLQLW